MPLTICPHCKKRVVIGKYSTDVTHDCTSSSPALQNDSIPKMGDWEDYTGSGNVSTPYLQGIENKVWGTRASVLGHKVHQRNVHGDRTSTHRLRKHQEFIEVKE